MKTKQILMLTVLLLGISLAREAQAFYNPSTGRWLSRDPAQEQGGLNLYTVALNDPLDFVDLLGNSISAASTPPAGGLTITVVEQAHKLGNCGGARMKVRWHVPPSSDGWIIQHITVTANIYDCKGYRVLTANNQNTSYLEAWQVVKGRILEKGKPADVDTFRTPAEGSCRKGQIYVLGKVQFLPLASYTLIIPPWSYGTVPEAPDMLTLQPVPSSWSDSGALNHAMLVNFNCCSFTDESVAGFPF